MKHLILPALLTATLAAAPAHATGGFNCRTAGSRPVQVDIGFGHVPGAPLFSQRLIDNGRQVPVTAPSNHHCGAELRLLLASPDAMRREVILRARKNGPFYDGSIWRNGQRRWVRCREG
jgi:hypothetical protein